MIKIRKGTQILDVPVKAYKEFYAVAGWEQVKEEKTVSAIERKIRSMTNKDLKELAQSKGIETAGVSKKTLVDALIQKMHE